MTSKKTLSIRLAEELRRKYVLSKTKTQDMFVSGGVVGEEIPILARKAVFTPGGGVDVQEISKENGDTQGDVMGNIAEYTENFNKEALVSNE